MKRITIIRHAKSSWDNPKLADEQRPLNERGIADALLIGNHLYEIIETPDLMISSPANRAISTARIIASASNYNDEILIEKSFYTFNDDGGIILNKISNLSDDLNSVTIYGHNDTFTVLAYRLSNKVIYEFPTCSVLSAEYDIEHWSEIMITSPTTYFFVKPKMLR